MGNVLKVTDGNGINHISPLSNKSFYESMNALGINGQDKYKLVEIDEKAVKSVPFQEPGFVTVEQAPDKIAELQAKLAAKEQEMLELQRRLGSTGNVSLTPNTVVGMQPNAVADINAEPHLGRSGDPAEVGSLLNQLGAGETKAPNDGILPKVKAAVAKAAPATETPATNA